MSNDIIVCYERHGDYAKNVLDYFLKRILRDKNIKWVENNKSSKLIVYTKYGRNTTNKSKLYIGFSGECYAPPLLPRGYKGLYFLAYKKISQNTLHFPYFLSSPYLYKEPIDNSIDRPRTSAMKRTETVFVFFITSPVSNIISFPIIIFGKMWL